MSPISNKIRYSDTELEEFDKLLDEKIAKGNESLDYYLSQIQDRADADDNKLKSLSDASGSCLLYTSPSPRDATLSRMPSSA